MDTYPIFQGNFRPLFITLGILIATLLLQTIVRKSLRIAFSKLKGKINESRYARTTTIRLLLANIINTVIMVIAVITILSTWGVDVRPILTGLGIFGLALSFGSQSLVKDFISGFFIIFEDQFNVGDKIKIGTVEGIVKKITIRSTVVKDKDGNRTYIPNSKIDIITRLDFPATTPAKDKDKTSKKS